MNLNESSPKSQKNDIEWNKTILVSEFDLTWDTNCDIFSILDSRQSPKMERRSNARDPSSSEAHQAGHLHQRDVSHQPPGSVVTRPHRVMSPGFTPDNSCCFCLTLRSGTSIIAGLNCVFYIGAIIWWALTNDKRVLINERRVLYWPRVLSWLLDFVSSETLLFSSITQLLGTLIIVCIERTNFMCLN